MEPLMGITWIEAEETRPDDPLDKFQRSYGVSDNGEIYIPMFLFGPEEELARRAEVDGYECAAYLGHPYASLTWVRAEFPYLRGFCDHAEKKIRKILQSLLLNN
jgi:hypothetical protein